MSSFLSSLFHTFGKKELPKTRVPPKGPSVSDYPFEVKTRKFYFSTNPIFLEETKKQEPKVEKELPKYVDKCAETETEPEIKEQEIKNENVFFKSKIQFSFDLDADDHEKAEEVQEDEESKFPEFKFSYYKGNESIQQPGSKETSKSSEKIEKSKFIIKSKNPKIMEKKEEKGESNIKFICSNEKFSLK